ncbi:PfkB family carbohydrate kinase [Mycetocola miduiensis]|uniref:Fructokinase n=1 Tax=Mycetocola miduiensis TaxID=995034 RepID=A0A1I4YJQ8_9MICO|nr:PfkB family carbohydrate kinase [Mycetocola miduiensis]SFN38311.1 fructokinase [Mycetocola miduiensis]
MHREEERVVVIGDALIDEMRDASGSRDFVGGAALNVAVGLARLGVPTTLIAMIGDDADGQRIRAFLDQYGVEFLATPGLLGSSRAISDRAEGEPRYTFNEAARARRVVFGDEERLAIADARLVVVSCFPFDDDEQAAALEDAVANPGRRLVLDPNPRAGMLHDAGRFVSNFERLASTSLLCKVGDEDAHLLYGIELPQLVERLRQGGAANVLATAGRNGASVSTPTGTASRPIADLPGPVVDTMGAGDATLAAAVHTLATAGVPAGDAEWGRLLDDAMLVAAHTCRQDGALLQLPPVA